MKKTKLFIILIICASFILAASVALAQSNSGNNPFDVIRAEIQTLQGHVDSFFDVFVEVDVFKNTISGLQNQIDSFFDVFVDIDLFNNSISGLQGQIDSFFDVFVEVDPFNDAISGLQNQIDSFFDVFVEVDVYDNDIAALESRIAGLEAQVAELSGSPNNCCTEPCCHPETCDGEDNDCDGRVDEDISGVGDACNTGLLGVCSEGMMSCSGGEMQCTPIHEPLEEICDGLDNDCDGSIDEGLGVLEGCGECVDLNDPSTWGNKIELSEYGYFLLKDDVLLCPGIYDLSSDGGIQIVRPNLGHVLNCNGATLRGDGAISGTGAGVRVGCLMSAPYLPCFSDVVVKNCNIENFNVGIKVNMADRTTVVGNNVTNTNYGITLDGSQESVVKNNTVTDNNYDGISLDYGLGSRESLNNEVSGNTTRQNRVGIRVISIHDTLAGNNEIFGNTVEDNTDYGIYIYGGTGNTIYNNLFDNNGINGYSYASSSLPNTWNTTKTAGTNIIGGPYLGGNYWSDYAGVDSDGDGLGNTLLPYNSNGNINVGGDELPLVE